MNAGVDRRHERRGRSRRPGGCRGCSSRCRCSAAGPARPRSGRSRTASALSGSARPGSAMFQLRSGMMLSATAPFAISRSSNSSMACFARAHPVEPGRAGQRAARDDQPVELVDGGEGLRDSALHNRHRPASSASRERGWRTSQYLQWPPRPARSPAPSLPAQKSTRSSAAQGSGARPAAQVGREHVAFGGVARRRERQHVGLVVDLERGKVRVDAARAWRGCAARPARASTPGSGATSAGTLPDVNPMPMW